MKKYTLFTIFLITIINTCSFAQSTTCSSAFYDRNYIRTPMAPVGSTAQVGPDYGCVEILTRPQWGYFVSCYPSTVEPSFSYYSGPFSWTTNYFSLVIWGPFSTLNNVCNNLTSSNIFYCRDSIQVPPVNGLIMINTQISTLPGQIYYYMITTADTLAIDTIYSHHINNASPWSMSDTCYLCNSEVSTLLPQDICQVTVDAVAQKTRIVWERIPDAGVAGYIIRRAPQGTWAMDSVGYVSESDPCEFLDLTSHPLQYGEEYRLQPVDSCGNSNFYTSNLYVTHKVCYLQATPAGNNTSNLNWNIFGEPQNEFEPVQYVYRGTDPLNMQIIDSIPPFVTSYTDITAPPGLNYYSIERRRLSACNPLRSASGSNYLGSFSNPSGVTITGLTEVNTDQIFDIGPVPTSQLLEIKTGNYFLGAKMVMLDNNGKKIYEGYLNKNSESIDVSNFSSGIYWLQVFGKINLTRKVLVSR